MTATLCPRCGAAVLSVRTFPGWRVFTLLFGVTAAPVYRFVVDDLARLQYACHPTGPLILLEPGGGICAGRLARYEGQDLARRSDDEVATTAHVVHDVACPAAKERAQLPPGNKGECRGCGQTIHWIRTPAGKNAPVDPAPRFGTRLSDAERRSAAGTPGYVIGLDPFGDQAAIREEDPRALRMPGLEVLTVWVNHFATCPRRDQFARSRGR